MRERHDTGISALARAAHQTVYHASGMLVAERAAALIREDH